MLCIRLRQEVKDFEFSSRCQVAQSICKDYLQDLTLQSPEIWTLEYLFQFLQQHVGLIQFPSERASLLEAFLEDEVPKALGLLIGKRSPPIAYAIAFRQALDEDWEFRFTVNYFLRENQYCNTPYIRLRAKINSIFSTIPE